MRLNGDDAWAEELSPVRPRTHRSLTVDSRTSLATPIGSHRLLRCSRRRECILKCSIASLLGSAQTPRCAEAPSAETT
jgi:hypothetical protein